MTLKHISYKSPFISLQSECIYQKFVGARGFFANISEIPTKKTPVGDRGRHRKL
jgi:hypothetical protein